MNKIVTIVLLLSLSTCAFSQSPRFRTILYGAAYYHEYMPYERLEKDVQLMQGKENLI